jgi:hypothetical protein
MGGGCRRGYLRESGPEAAGGKLANPERRPPGALRRLGIDGCGRNPKTPTWRQVGLLSPDWLPPGELVRLRIGGRQEHSGGPRVYQSESWPEAPRFRPAAARGASKNPDGLAVAHRRSQASGRREHSGKPRPAAGIRAGIRAGSFGPATVVSRAPCDERRAGPVPGSEQRAGARCLDRGLMSPTRQPLGRSGRRTVDSAFKLYCVFMNLGVFVFCNSGLARIVVGIAVYMWTGVCLELQLNCKRRACRLDALLLHAVACSP